MRARPCLVSVRKNGLNACIVQAALGLHVMIDGQQIADVALLYHDVFVQRRFGKFEIQQAPSAQHRNRVKAAAECRALVVDVGRERRGESQAGAVIGRDADAHRLRERDLVVQDAFQSRSRCHA